jgi:ATP phosphoribosyltransferase regulatory subunit
MQFLTIKDELVFLKKRYQLMQILESIVNKKGYIKVEPDYFEPYERFIQMNKRISKESMVKIIQNDGSLSILRPDITTNIIKQVIPKWSNDVLLKLFYTSTTFSSKPYLPIKEDRHFGVELLGDYEDGELEMIELMLSIFETFKLDYMIEIGNQRFLNLLFEKLNLSENNEKQLKEIIDTKNQSALDKFLKQVVESSEKNIISSIFEFEGSLETIISKLNGFSLDQNIIDAIFDLKRIDAYVKKNNFANKIAYDLSLMSKYDYYDGLTFKGYLRHVSFPILSGGRYDPLTEAFGKRISAIGFSINLNELIKEVVRA